MDSINQSRLPVVGQSGSRACGRCSLCCKVMGVVELNKPAGKRCEHAILPVIGNKGCRIYDTRPESCRVFNCMWLMDQIPYNLRPLDSKVVIVGPRILDSGQDLLTVNVDTSYPDAWREKTLWNWIESRLSRGTAIAIVCGQTQFTIGERNPPPEAVKSTIKVDQ